MYKFGWRNSNNNNRLIDHLRCKKNRKLLRLVASLSLLPMLLLFLSACNHDVIPSNGPSHDIVQPKRLEVRWSWKPSLVTAGEEAELHLRIKKDGDIPRGVPLLVWSSENLDSFFRVLDLSPGEEVGEYRAPIRFPSGGTYRLWLTFPHSEGRWIPESHLVAVQGSTGTITTGGDPSSESLTVDTNPEKSMNGARVIMQTPGPLRAHQGVVLTFSLRDDMGRGFIRGSSDHLASMARLVVLSPGSDELLYYETDGEFMRDPRFSFVVVFPRPGKYRLWAELPRSGGMITVPYTVEVL
ncbi:hypothetical protein [Pasteuria penetrans]|uniref:hypothetical protein n=1 Tax=Pasteuria penetrans TaxID=86005 RepID=UPI000FA97675|nr:hypothetical protein [Pasteuria penetrans]